MDAIDAEIMEVLTANARASLREIGAEVGLSANAVAARMRRMEKDGVIAGYTVVRGAAAATELEVYIDIRLQQGADTTAFLAKMRTLPQVRDAAHITGAFDAVVHAAVPDTQALNELLRVFKAECFVAQSQTRVVLGRADDRRP